MDCISVRATLVAALLSPIFVVPASASDGALEINQTCAVRTGCFSGDAAGFPVTIDGTAGRGYRLTSDLIVPDENTDAIFVSTDDIGVDLNGFTIRGPVTCSGSPLACTPSSGIGSGVKRVSLTNRGISVKNGSITGMGQYGVLLGEQAEVLNLRVRWNRSIGIFATSGSTLSGNTAYQNGQGITGGSGSTLSGNTAYQNGTFGISAGDGATLSVNTAFQNGGIGVSGAAGSTVSGNTAYQNGGDGISAGLGSTVSGNTAHDNGDATNPALDDGIQCTQGCFVHGNTVRDNSGAGLALGTDSAYSDNVVTNNATATVSGVGSANNRGGNYCAGTGTGSANCP